MLYNAEHGLADVYAPDQTLLGAVPADAVGETYTETAIATYAGEPGDATARAARRVIVLAGGTPNIPADPGDGPGLEQRRPLVTLTSSAAPRRRHIACWQPYRSSGGTT